MQTSDDLPTKLSGIPLVLTSFSGWLCENIPSALLPNVDPEPGAPVGHTDLEGLYLFTGGKSHPGWVGKARSLARCWGTEIPEMAS